MKNADLLRRVFAVSMAAAIAAANVGFDFLPMIPLNSRTSADDQAESVSAPKTVTKKSKYPTSLSFIVEKNEDGDTIIKASDPKVFAQFFTAELVDLSEDGETIEFSPEGTVISEDGSYTVNVSAKTNEDGEIVENPYKLISTSVPVPAAVDTVEESAGEDETTAPEEEAPAEETADSDEETAPEEEAPEVEESEDASEEEEKEPEITEIAVTVIASEFNANAGIVEAAEKSYSYYALRNGDSYDIIIPEDYDVLSVSSISEDGTALFLADGEEVEVDLSAVESDIRVIGFAELKTKEFDAENYTIERFCAEDAEIPYYYGEVVKLTPAESYKVVVGESESIIPIGFTVGDDTPEAVEARYAISVTGASADQFTVSGKNMTDEGYLLGTEVKVSLNAGALSGRTYKLSVVSDSEGGTIESAGKALEFKLTPELVSAADTSTIAVESSDVADAIFKGIQGVDSMIAGFECVLDETTSNIRSYRKNMNEDGTVDDHYYIDFNYPGEYSDGEYYAEIESFCVRAEGSSGDEGIIAKFDGEGKVISAIDSAQEDAVTAADTYHWTIKLDPTDIHTNAVLEIEYTQKKRVQVTFDFNTVPEGIEPQITAKLNDTDITRIKEGKFEDVLKTNTNSISFAAADGWEITGIVLNNAVETDKAIEVTDPKLVTQKLGTKEQIKRTKANVYTIELTKQKVDIRVNLMSNDTTVYRIMIGEETAARSQGFYVGTVDYGDTASVGIYPNAGYYVKSIEKVIDDDNGEVIFADGKVVDKRYNASDAYTFSFNSKSCGEVIITESDFSEAALYAVEMAKVSDLAEQPDIVIEPEYGSVAKTDGEYKIFRTLEDGVTPNTFKLSCKDAELMDYEIITPDYSFAEKIDFTVIQENGSFDYIFYIAKDNIISKYTMQISTGSTEPVVSRFEITAENSLLRYLTFGIFGNKDAKVKVYAKDTSDFALDICDIKLNNGKNTELKADSDDVKKESDGEWSKTWTLSDVGNDSLSKIAKKFELVSVAYATFGTEDSNPIEGEYYVIEPGETAGGKKIEANAAPLENGNIPVIIENISPVITSLKTVGETDGWFRDSAGFIIGAADGGDVYSGISAFNIYKDGGSKPINTIEIDTTDAAYNTLEKLRSLSGFELTDAVKLDSTEVGVFSSDIEIEAVDNAGNTSDRKKQYVKLDTAPPDMKISTNGYEEGTWTNGIVTLTADVSDGKGSGIKSVTAVDEKNGVEFKNTGSNSAAVFEIKPSFNGTVTITAVDNVGNETVKDIVVKTENLAPKAIGIEITGSQGYGSDSGLKDFATEYGYFFDVDVNVEVTASDPINDTADKHTAGISDIIIAFVDHNDMDADGNYPASAIKVQNIGTFTPYDDGTAVRSFTISNDFDGQILIKVRDIAGNESDWCSPDMLIAETLDAHANHAGAVITLPDSDYKDADGNYLYGSAPTLGMWIYDNGSGIRTVTWRATSSETGSVLASGTTAFAEGSDAWSTEWKRNVAVSAYADIPLSTVNENSVMITLTGVDNAGNTIEIARKTISIDKNDPVIIGITFDPAGSSGQKYFNSKRTATVAVQERNLKSDSLEKAVSVAVKNALGTSAEPYKIGSWSLRSGSVKSTRDTDNTNIYTCQIAFNQDAEYTFSIEIEDLTGKKAKSDTYNFVVDTTKPVLDLSFDNNKSKNEKYYDASRKATIKIKEHNFENKDAVVTVLNAKDKDGIAALDNKLIFDKLTWTQDTADKDTWTAQISFGREGTFALSIAYSDPAGNGASPASSGEFVIDTSAPKIEQTFTNGGNEFATNAEITPHVVFSDFNFNDENKVASSCKVTIKKYGEDGITTKDFDCTSSSFTNKSSGNPISYERIYDIFADELEVDGIYEITITAEDLAGNTSTSGPLTLSVNRFGPTYMIVNEEALNAVSRFSEDGSPVMDPCDVHIAVVNVTPTKGDGTIHVNLDNKNLYELESFEVEESRVMKKNDEWQEDGDGWYQTLYKISKKNFGSDGTYTITLESEDESGNSNSSDIARPPRESFAAKFAIDSTPPVVIIAGADQVAYDEAELGLTITCNDDNLFDLDKLVYDENSKDNTNFYVRINNDFYNVSTIRSKLGGEVAVDESDNIVITMNVKGAGKNSQENVDVFIKDKAGNETITSAAFTLSKSGILLWIILAVVGVCGIGTGTVFGVKKLRG